MTAPPKSFPQFRAQADPVSSRRVTAVLGPTNTGKTYLAIERMMGHASGMIGFPLRLLARENYDRVRRMKGGNQVALVTGEEKIVPPGARYFLCTVESMPVARPVEFLAIDEVQLCADPERGHIFTERLLHARGLAETMFLGAETVRGVLKRLVPEAEVVTRPRFSTLSYAGPKKLTRLPPRSAVVAFSAADVYATAELMRRNRGGTAVVLGALSPRTRNAQVAMFEAGEVDYLVATDAIGMGLNLDLDHVAFARLSKFDGRAPRRLTATEVAQIAGRAGRHMSNGTFGTTLNLGEIDEELVEAVENHRFDPVRALVWRARERDLDFASPQALLKSLDAAPPAPELTRGREADDQRTLFTLSRDPEVIDLARDPGAVRLLWQVCQVPDFRKIMSDQHARLVARIYRHLMRGEGRLPEDWLGQQMMLCDRDDGDIDTLVARIAQVRTWTYVTHRSDWLDHAQEWQDKARAIEDRLSDALHERLTQRFVDRRTATLVRRLKGGDELLGAVKRSGEVVVEGEFVGRLQGFVFTPDSEATGEDQRPLLAAARRALTGEIPARLQKLESDDDGSFKLEDDLSLTWRGAPVARLAAGERALLPEVEALDSEFLDAAAKQRIRKRLMTWLERYQRNRLKPLHALQDAEISGALRGLAFQLVEELGSLPRRQVASLINDLGKTERKQLGELGARIGRESLFVPALLSPQAQRLKAQLVALRHGVDPAPLVACEGRLLVTGHPGESGDGETAEKPAFAVESVPAEAWQALGYRRFDPPRGSSRKHPDKPGAIALRVDALERLAGALAVLRPNATFTPAPSLVDLAGGDRAALDLLLPALGFPRAGGERDGQERDSGGDATSFAPRGRRRAPQRDLRAQGRGAAAQEQTGGDAVAREAETVGGAEKRRRRRRKPRPAEAAMPQSGEAQGGGQGGGQGSGQSGEQADSKPDRAKEKRDKRGGRPPERNRNRQGAARKPGPRWPVEPDPDHPFAKLKDLVFTK